MMLDFPWKNNNRPIQQSCSERVFETISTLNKSTKRIITFLLAPQFSYTAALSICLFCFPEPPPSEMDLYDRNTQSERGSVQVGVKHKHPNTRLKRCWLASGYRSSRSLLAIFLSSNATGTDISTIWGKLQPHSHLHELCDRLDRRMIVDMRGFSTAASHFQFPFWE